MIFDKPTLRTQASFASGIAELGGFPMIVDGALAQIGVRESVADTARVLGRQASLIVWRTYEQAGSRRWPRTPACPSSTRSPTSSTPASCSPTCSRPRAQGRAWPGSTVAFVGDGACNMGNSWLLAGATAGMHVRVSSPEGYDPTPTVVAAASRHRRRRPAARRGS